MQTDSPQSLIRAVKHFSSGTMLSRISGMGRDMIMAFAFGANPLIAAFMIAFRFSNLLRRIFGEGAMQSAFTPQFEDVRAKSHEAAVSFFKDLSATLSVFLIFLVIVVELTLFLILHFVEISQDNQEIIKLTALMFPGVIFICLFGINASLLQCEHKFFTSSVAPVAFNLIWIAAAFFFKDEPLSDAIYGLSFAIVLAYLCQWLITVPDILKFFRVSGLKSRFTLFSSDVRRLSKPLALGIIGVSAAQINSSVDPLFARAADLEGPAFLWYAIRIQQLPLALLGIAFSGALLPSLSRAVKALDEDKYCHLLNFGLRRSLSFMIPITFALFALGLSGTTLLFGRGDFDNRAIQETTYCLWGYGLGLLPMTMVLLFASAAFANHHFSKSAKASFLSMLLNVALNALFVLGFNLSSASVAVATSVAAFFNCYLMAMSIPHRERWCTHLTPCITKAVGASCFALVVTVIFGNLFVGDLSMQLLFVKETPLFPREFTLQALTLSAETLCFAASFLLGAWALQAEDILSIIRKKRPLSEN